jgi:acyl-CoA dehydrogenase
MDFKLTDVQEMTRDMVRDFAQNEVKPAAIILDKNAKPEDCIPWDLLKKASKLGLRTAAIPEEWGGEGADYTTLALILLELGKADHGFASIIRGSYTESPRLVHELSAEQRDEWLPKFLKDDTFLLGLGRTEPDAGTDSHFLYDEPGKSIQTYAELQGDEYVINGTKHFISSGGAAKLYFLYVRTDKKGPISTSMSVILVPSDAPGFTIGRYHNKFGRRLLPNAELVFQNCRVPAKNLIGIAGDAWGSEGEGGGGPQKDWTKGPGAPPPFGLLGAAVNLGTVIACYEEALNYCRQRIQGGRPVIEQQHVAIDLARMKVQIAAAEALLFKCCFAWEQRYDYDPKMGMLFKAFVDEIGLSIASKSISLFGGMGTGDDDFPISKYVRDVYTFLHGFSTTEVALLIGAPTA